MAAWLGFNKASSTPQAIHGSRRLAFCGMSAGKSESELEFNPAEKLPIQAKSSGWLKPMNRLS